jgi:hypothetical protein
VGGKNGMGVRIGFIWLRTEIVGGVNAVMNHRILYKVKGEFFDHLNSCWLYGVRYV